MYVVDSLCCLLLAGMGVLSLHQTAHIQLTKHSVLTIEDPFLGIVLS